MEKLLSYCSKCEGFKLSIIDELNQEQCPPVLATEGAVLVTAGAGSGKTRLLTHRIAYLIKEKNVSPYNILAITFTNKAAREMRDRVYKMVQDGDKIWVSTFHSLCVNILRRDIHNLSGYNSKFSIYGDTERNRVLKEIYTDLNIEDELKKSIEYHISNVKNQNISIEDYVNSQPNLIDEDLVISVYKRYNSALQASNALDFDDLLLKCYELFTKYPDVLHKYQERFRYIHVDEFQDTNAVQYDIVKLLAAKWGNIFVVGDEDQCVYGWRGADIKNIVNFQHDFPNVQIFKLEQNYRSTKKILEKANLVISNNLQRLKKTLWTENESGADVVYYVGESDRQEAEFVVRTISNLVRELGYSYSDIVILMRYSAPSRLFEEYMMQYNIPYKMLGGFKFFERQEIKNIIAYIRSIVNPLDNESITRIINVPKRGIGESTIEELRQKALGGSLLSVIRDFDKYDFSTSTKKKLSLFRDVYQKLYKASATMGIAEFVKYIIDVTNIRSQYNLQNEEDYNKLQNIDQFLSSVQDYEKLNPDSTLSEYLESITLISDIDTVSDDSNVLVSTIHAVKGLEFKCVFVVAMEEGIFPIIRSGDRPSDIEEERRLAYVAITRAKERLYLTRAKRRYLYNQIKNQEISRFLVEMGYEGNIEPSTKFREPYSFSSSVTPSTQSTNTSPSIKSMLESKINQQKKDLSAYKNGVQVLHPKFGVGVVVDDSTLNINRSITIDFGAIGIKVLSLDYAPLQIIKK